MARITKALKNSAENAANKIDVKTLLKGVGMSFEEQVFPTLKVVPSGFTKFDNEVLKIGGWPVGKPIQFWGPKSAMKTALAYRTVANFQSTFPDKIAVWVDAESSFNKDWAKDMGVDLSRFMLIPDHTADVIFDKLHRVVASGAVSIAVVDSIGNLRTSNQRFDVNAKEQTKGRPGEFAAEVTNNISDLANECHRTETSLLFINQIRTKIGCVSPNTKVTWRLNKEETEQTRP